MLWEHTESAKYVKGSRANVDTVVALGRGGHAFQQSDADRQGAESLGPPGLQRFHGQTRRLHLPGSPPGGGGRHSSSSESPTTGAPFLPRRVRTVDLSALPVA